MTTTTKTFEELFMEALGVSEKKEEKATEPKRTITIPVRCIIGTKISCCKEKEETPTQEQTLGLFADYKGMLVNYVATGKADLNLAIVTAKICHLDEAHKALFIMYISQYWEEYTFDTINGNYRYVKLTEIVYNAWLRHMAE